MKIAILGDCHLGVRNGSKIFSEYFDNFYSNIFFPYLKENNIDTVVQLGDLFDHRKYTNLQGLSEAKQYFFDRAKDQCVKLMVLVGNHDIYHKNTLMINSPSLLLGEYDNIEILQNPCTKEIGGINVDIIPWICQENESECLELMKTSKADVCFGHFEIIGFGMIRGILAHDGLETNMFSKYEYVFSGHYHHRSNRGNIYYTGTPYELTWNDYNDPKGFYVFDTETRSTQFINNPYRLFNKIYYDDAFGADIIREEIQNEKNNHLKNTYVKVVVKNKEDGFLFDSYLESLYKTNPVDLAIIEENIDVLSEEMEEIDETEDTLTILNKFIDNIKQKDLDTNKIKNILSDLYTEAMSIET